MYKTLNFSRFLLTKATKFLAIAGLLLFETNAYSDTACPTNATLSGDTCQCNSGYTKTNHKYETSANVASGDANSYTMAANGYEYNVQVTGLLGDSEKTSITGQVLLSNASSGLIQSTQPGTITGNKCYCRIVAPFETLWVYTQSTTSTLQACAVKCIDKIKGSNNIYKFYGSNILMGGEVCEETSASSTTYNITYKDGSNSISGLTPNNYTSETATFTLPTPTKDGYIFAEWCENAELTQNCSANKTISQGSTGNKTFYAKWLTITYTIKYMDNTSVMSGLTPNNYDIKTATFTLPTPTKNGYVFAEWCDDAELTQNCASERTITQGSTGNKTFYAKWNAVDYTITYMDNTDTISGLTPNNYNVATATFTLPTPTKNGYVFAEWCDDAELTQNCSANKTITQGSTGDKTFYAKWICENGRYNHNGTCAPCPIGSYVSDGTATACIPCAGGYTTDSTGASSVVECVACPYIEGSNDWLTTEWDTGVVKHLCEPVCDSRYTKKFNLTNWDYGTIPTEVSDIGVINGDGYKLNAEEFNISDEREWAIRFGNGILRGIASCNESQGDDDSGNSWTATDNNIKPGNTFTQDSTGSNCWCRATGINDTNIDSSSWIYYGSTDSETSCSDSCAFTGCVGMTTGIAEVRTALLSTSDSAEQSGYYCQPNEYNIVYKDGNNPIDYLSGSTYTAEDYGQNLATISKNYYDFDGWCVDSANCETPITTIPNNWYGDKTLYAHWTAINYTITYMDDASVMSGLTPNTYNITTATFTLPKPTKANYVFIGWCDDAELTQNCSANKTITQGSTGNKTFYAKWSQSACEPGYYLSATTNRCEKCSEPGYYCPGGEFEPQSYDQGKKECPEIKNYGGAAMVEYSNIDFSACYASFVYSHSFSLYNFVFGSEYVQSLTQSQDYDQNSPLNANVEAMILTCKYNESTESYDECFLYQENALACKNGYYTPVLPSDIYTETKEEALQPVEHFYDICQPAQRGYYTTFYDTAKSGLTSEEFADYEELAYNMGTIVIVKPIDSGKSIIYEYYDIIKMDSDSSLALQYTQCPPEYPNSEPGSWKKTQCYAETTYSFDDGDDEDIINKVYYTDENTSGFKPELPQITRDGYTFDGWYDSHNNLVTNSTTVTGNETLSARWTPVQYQITYVLNNGSEQNQQETYTIETDAFALPTPTRDGYNFNGWCDDEELTENCATNRTIQKGSTGNKTFYAKWTLKEFVCDGVWLHIGDDARTCLSETKVTSPAVGVQIGNKKYYLQTSLDTNKKVNKDTNIKLRMYYGNQEYNIHDASESN
jgi:uncharacterized repeat protein (TIGR02543 family)